MIVFSETADSPFYCHFCRRKVFFFRNLPLLLDIDNVIHMVCLDALFLGTKPGKEEPVYGIH